jgi:hypothetical protein
MISISCLPPATFRRLVKVSLLVWVGGGPESDENECKTRVGGNPIFASRLNLDLTGARLRMRKDSQPHANATPRWLRHSMTGITLRRDGKPGFSRQNWVCFEPVTAARGFEQVGVLIDALKYP